MSKFTYILTALVFALLARPGAQAQSIYGRTLLGTDTILSQASITLYSANAPIGHYLSDSTGFFSIPAIDTGQYNMLITHNNVTDTFRNISIPDANPMYISFVLGHSHYLLFEEMTICRWFTTFDMDEPGTRTFSREELSQMPH